jgi:carboxylesterase type B
MVYIHGGGFDQGSGYGPYGLYNGEFLASTYGVVVVTFNYRLGALGFLSTPSAAGNFGFKDQQFALDWIQQNIQAFGAFVFVLKTNSTPFEEI